MNHQKITSLLLLLVGLAWAGSSAANTPDAACLAHARASFTAFAEGHYDQVRTHFAPDAVPALTADKMHQIGKRLGPILGQYKELGDFRPATVHGKHMLVAPLVFASGRLAALVTCDDQHRITQWGAINPAMLPDVLPPVPEAGASAGAASAESTPGASQPAPAASSPQAGAAPASAQCKAHAQQALDALTDGQFQAARKHFSPATAKAVSADKLRTTWQQLTKRFGGFDKLGPLQAKPGGGLVAALYFKNARWEVDLACDDANRITRFLAHPSQPAPTSDDVAGVTSSLIKVPSPVGPLGATLDVPNGTGPFPAVVFAAGSGPNDRDETTPFGKPFRDIAVGLAKAGIASLRFDKRAYAHAAQMKGQAITVDDEETDDVLSAIQVLAKQAHIDDDRLFIIGHSEGAMLAPRIAKRSGRLAGIIMLAAPARPLLPILADQYRALEKMGMPASKVKQKEKAVAAEQKLLANADPAKPPSGRFMNAPQSFWLSLHDYHQVKVAKSLSLPMLFLQGGRDYKVSPSKDFGRWKQALGGRANVSFHLYPDLVHLFFPAAGSTGYVIKPNSHVPAAVVDDIATWIKAQPAVQ